MLSLGSMVSLASLWPYHITKNCIFALLPTGGQGARSCIHSHFRTFLGKSCVDANWPVFDFVGYSIDTCSSLSLCRASIYWQFRFRISSRQSLWSFRVSWSLCPNRGRIFLRLWSKWCAIRLYMVLDIHSSSIATVSVVVERMQYGPIFQGNKFQYVSIAILLMAFTANSGWLTLTRWPGPKLYVAQTRRPWWSLCSRCVWASHLPLLSRITAMW